MEAILSLVKEGLLLPHVSHSFPLEKAILHKIYTNIFVHIWYYLVSWTFWGKGKSFESTLQAVEGLAAKWDRKVVGGAVIDCS